jgi:hypothetical protein
MSAMQRDTMEKFWQRWLDANRDAERNQDWSPLADFYVEDATYGWMYQPDEHFMAVNREEIRKYALGTEMAGLEGWHYDYVVTMMDETKSMIVGFWRQRAGIEDDNGKEYEILGIGGSWFGLEERDGEVLFAWQRDWFDLGAAAHCFLSIAADGKATEGLQARMSLHGPSQPGHYKLENLPSTVWPPPVDAGDFIEQKAFTND